MAGVTWRNIDRNIDVTLGPAKAGSVTLEGSPPLGGAQCYAHAPRFDLTGHWSTATADLIRDAWITWRDGTDPQPIRDRYREQPQEVRAVLANIMTGGTK